MATAASSIQSGEAKTSALARVTALGQDADEEIMSALPSNIQFGARSAGVGDLIKSSASASNAQVPDNQTDDIDSNAIPSAELNSDVPIQLDTSADTTATLQARAAFMHLLITEAVSI